MENEITTIEEKSTTSKASEFFIKVEKFFFPKPKKMTAMIAWNQTRYNCNYESLEEIAKVIAHEIEEYISYKTRSSSKETCVIRQVPQNEDDVYSIVIKHFKDLGYIVLMKTFPELGDDRYLIISWVNGGRMSL